MQDPVDFKNPHRPIRVGVIVLNSKTEILDVAPLDIFSGISKEFLPNFPPHLITDRMRKEALDVEYHWVTEHGQDAVLAAGAIVKATHDFKTCPPLDVVMMGAHVVNYAMTEAEIAFLQKANQECQALLFICGGFLAALQSGLLTGKTGTAPRPMVDHLRQTNPEVNWVAKRWVQDGKIWTSGALLNGTDLAKAFAESIWGGEGSFVDMVMRMGGYPFRDVDYKDVPWDI
ncbi:hypothetical protein LTR53_006636 [Teratosphaeriaceae sp. CCFEE 6253]|nr:hypothetical protein LTR53_006636 [Teratosphaeriaceae sp. CCFEE 6253]